MIGALLTGLLLAAMLIGCAERVERPALASHGAKGRLAIGMETGMAAAEYHHPAEWWRRNHMRFLARGENEDEGRYDYSPRECLVCHNPRTSCNVCHRYVGVSPVLEDYETED
jgi:hypothetical protein